MNRGSDAYLAEIESWRTRRLARLTAPDGWLSVIGLHWLEEGANAIGSAASARIRLPEGRGADDLGWIEVAGGDASLHSGGRAVPLAADPADERPFLRRGALSLSLIRRGERMAVRVRDRRSELRERFRTVAAFPVDPAWRIEARFEPHAPPRTIEIPNVLGTMDQEISPGALLFDAGGDIRRLDPILEAGETDYWVIFGDATNGRETYGGGRFVYVKPPVNGRTVIDFNKAYNPPCVFTPYSTCPLPPPQNRLTLRVEAGERAYAG